MEDFVSIDQIKNLFRSAQYINLSTIRGDGTPHPSNVRITHGHSLSMYFLSESTSQKSRSIEVNHHISGSLLISEPKPGTGVNLFFNGVAHRVDTDCGVSLLPEHVHERESAIRALCEGRQDYNDNLKNILDGKTDIALYRILLTQAWYNGGIYKNSAKIESNATRSLRIVGDKSCPLIRRYLIDDGQITPEHAIDLPSKHIEMALGLN